ncbi:hypothetical protein EUGRSUZ_F00476 [Eucalyptus grandis]|uniref:Uncharacterized protein n=2 Tax=Eucalyptus grandis TaxID=71139 RepID=A0ACC3KAJ9_EUCGR|nr:hypothetical protein EUGRSUZ_F00476 [Eucalyptus grandis]
MILIDVSSPASHFMDYLRFLCALIGRGERNHLETSFPTATIVMPASPNTCTIRMFSFTQSWTLSHCKSSEESNYSSFPLERYGFNSLGPS